MSVYNELKTERALADDLAAVLIALVNSDDIDVGVHLDDRSGEVGRVLARYRQARS